MPPRRKKGEIPQEEVLDLGEVVHVAAFVGEGDRAKTTKKVVEGALRWTKMKGSPQKCDDCVQAMVDGGPWHAPGVAVYKRQHRGTERLLCYAHTAAARAADGLEMFKKGGR